MPGSEPAGRSERGEPAIAGRAPDPDEVVALAESLMLRSADLETPREARARRRFAALLDSPAGIAFTTTLLDRALRPRDPRAVAAAVSDLVHGRLEFLNLVDRTLLRAFVRASSLAPGPAVAIFRRRLREEAHRYILDAEPAQLADYLRRRHAEGVVVNVNLVGEAVLGHGDAEARLTRYEAALASPEIEAIAVKISSITPMVHPLAYDRVVDDVSVALRRLYRAAGDKLVTLDMEEYKDLEPTVAAYSRVLMEDEFSNRTQGIALQAYLPDSYTALEMLTQIGAERVGRGGAPLRLRLVKGANLAMEQLTARLSGWEQAPYATKADVDANMKRMLAWALAPEHAAVAHVGVGSHNLFDIAFAIKTAELAGTEDMLYIEMLEGMAEPLRRAVAEVVPRQLLYAPSAGDAGILSAMAYLIRRLDENTSQENFLRHAFTMTAGDREWIDQADRFRASCIRIDDLSARPRRRPLPRPEDGRFVNEPNTDWVRTTARRRVLRALRETRLDELGSPATPDEIDFAVGKADSDPSGWAERPERDRADILLGAADRLRTMRTELIGLMAHETHKTVAESDPEVSEAIDLISYYANWRAQSEIDTELEIAPRGAVAVFSPWNFPIAIPLGGVAAALIAGNRVILKPSPYAVRVAAAGVRALWDAGVPRDALALLHTEIPEAAQLASHPDLDALVFTGSTITARKIIRARPDLRFIAETGGKNTMIVTATADRDLAIANILESAFGHSGQKCSATSLVIAVGEVFDDPAFRRRLEDGVATLRVGTATEMATDITRLVTPPNDACREVLSDAVRTIAEDGVVAPTVLWDVAEGSTPHMRELFGPLLAVMRADDLADALRIANVSGYGLTAGLESLREVDWRFWADRIRAGNLYVNRPTTGAIVQRQPFGGWGMSGYGPGAKAGGPNYVAQLCHCTGDKGHAALNATYDTGFVDRIHDPQQIPGQANIFRYVPATGVVIRVEHGDDPHAVHARRNAARAVGCAVDVSTFATESTPALADRLGDVTRVVRCGPSSDPQLLAAAAENWVWVCTDPIIGTNRDLLPFVREQTVSVDYHRHGWVPPGADPTGWLTDV